jgi:hypothetical protein
MKERSSTVFVVYDEGDLKKSRHRFKRAWRKAYERWNVNRLANNSTKWRIWSTETGFNKFWNVDSTK